MMCAYCGQPVDLAKGNLDDEKAYHGECYRLAFPPEHPEDWPKPIQNASQALRDGWREDV